MMEHLPQAFAVDIRVRRRNYSPEGVQLVAHEIDEGAALEADGIKISAFEVDHGGEELPAFGYRIEYQGRSAVLSGDTTFNENLIQHAQGADLLVHEVTAAPGSAAEIGSTKRIGSNHTTPEQGGEVRPGETKASRLQSSFAIWRRPRSRIYSCHQEKICGASRCW